jgi:hypothetical protein
MRIVKLHFKAWFAFLVTFYCLHFLFWAFMIVRNAILNGSRGFDGEGSFSLLLVLILFGPLTGFEFAVGYALVEITTSISRPSSFRIQAISAICAALVSYSLVWIVLSTRTYVPELFESIADSYLGNVKSHNPWGPVFLGGLAALIVVICVSGVSWIFSSPRAAQPAAGADR